jgi:hypothetical protein
MLILISLYDKIADVVAQQEAANQPRIAEPPPLDVIEPMVLKTAITAMTM